VVEKPFTEDAFTYPRKYSAGPICNDWPPPSGDRSGGTATGTKSWRIRLLPYCPFAHDDVPCRVWKSSVFRIFGGNFQPDSGTM